MDVCVVYLCMCLAVPPNGLQPAINTQKAIKGALASLDCSPDMIPAPVLQKWQRRPSPPQTNLHTDMSTSSACLGVGLGRSRGDILGPGGGVGMKESDGARMRR